MRYAAAEKLEIIRLVEGSHLPVRRTLARVGVPATTFYRWYDRYREHGPKGLEDRSPRPSRVWNRIPDPVRDRILALALEVIELRRVTGRQRNRQGVEYLFQRRGLPPAQGARPDHQPAFIVMRAADAFTEQTTAPNQLWQTDFTYLKVIGWGWFYLSTILDDYSRFIVAWKLCTTMRAGDVTDTLDLALAASGCDTAKVVHRPRLLSDNGASYVAGDLARWLEGKGIAHIRGAPNHPQTQGKIERWHQTLKNRVLLENYFLPGQLEAAVADFVDHYNHHRYHESLGNLTPADVYFGRGAAILEAREKIKKLTIRNRRLSHHGRAA